MVATEIGLVGPSHSGSESRLVGGKKLRVSSAGLAASNPYLASAYSRHPLSTKGSTLRTILMMMMVIFYSLIWITRNEVLISAIALQKSILSSLVVLKG